MGRPLEVEAPSTSRRPLFDRVTEVIHDLPVEQQVLLDLRHGTRGHNVIFPLTYRELGERMRCSATTASRRYHRTMALVRELAEQLP